MQLKGPVKKQLEAGLHLVTIKSIATQKGANGTPASWPDPSNNNQPTGALEVLFMGKGGYGIKDTFWLALSELKKLTALMQAIGLDNSKGQIDAELVIGKKLWLQVAQVMVFNTGMIPEIGTDGKQLSYGRPCKIYWPASKDMPKVEGNPQDNGGVASGNFLFHFCDGKTFKPLPVEPKIEKQSAWENPDTNVELIQDQMESEGFTKAQIDEYIEKTNAIKTTPSEYSLPTRPFSAYELRMKSRCELCEKAGLIWNPKTNAYEGNGVYIREDSMLNDLDEVFNTFFYETFPALKPATVDPNYNRLNFRAEMCQEIGLIWNGQSYMKDDFNIHHSELVVDDENTFAGKISDIQIEMKRRASMIKTNPAVPGSFYNDQPVEQLQKQTIQFFGEVADDKPESPQGQADQVMGKINADLLIAAANAAPAPFGIIDDEPEQPTTLKPFGL